MQQLLHRHRFVSVHENRCFIVHLQCQLYLTCVQAVIGAGAAGLVAARELVLEGHHVTVFEKGSSTGGVWVYTDEVEAPDLLGMHQLHLSVCILMGMAILIMVTHMSACANVNAHSSCFTAY